MYPPLVPSHLPHRGLGLAPINAASLSSATRPLAPRQGLAPQRRGKAVGLASLRCPLEYDHAGFLLRSSVVVIAA